MAVEHDTSKVEYIEVPETDLLGAVQCYLIWTEFCEQLVFKDRGSYKCYPSLSQVSQGQ